MPNVKTGKRNDKMVILELFTLEKDKTCIVLSLTNEIQGKKCESSREFGNGVFRERTSYFSLEYRVIRPLVVFGTRRKAALCGEGFAWVPDLGSFLKLLEVGVSPYLGFILCLSTLSIFELIEAVRGCLIGPKTWDRIIGN